MGLACERAGGAGRAPLTERGGVRDGLLTPPGGPHQHPRASTPRNFRKHLRMVGSRRVKAQSKAQSQADGWGLGLGWGAQLLADWGLACCSLRPQGGRPQRAPSHTEAPPKDRAPPLHADSARDPQPCPVCLLPLSHPSRCSSILHPPDPTGPRPARPPVPATSRGCRPRP